MNYENLLILNPKEMEKERKQQLKRLNKIFPLPHLKDTDRDGVPDILDCNPYNYYEHGLWSWVKSKFTSPKPSPKPSPPPVSGGVIGAPHPALIKGAEVVGAPHPALIGGGGVSGGGVSGGGVSGGGGISGGGSYSGGTYTSPTGQKFSMSEAEAKKLGARVKPTAKEIESAKLGTATPEQLGLGTATSEQLGLGTSIVTAYVPPTKKELEESERLRLKYRDTWGKKLIEKGKELGKGFISDINLPYIKLAGEYKKPPTLVEKETLGRGGTIQLFPPTIEQLEERKYFEEVGKRKMTHEQAVVQMKLDATSKSVASDIADNIKADNENKVREAVDTIQQKINNQEISLTEGENELKGIIDKINVDSLKKFDTLYSSKMKPYISEAQKTLEKRNKEILTKMKKQEEEDKKWYEIAGDWITGATPQKWFKENVDPWITEHLKNPLHERFPFITEYKTKIETWFENLSSRDSLNKASDSVKKEKLKELLEKGQINYKGQTYRIGFDGKIERVTSSPFPSWLSGTTFGLEPSEEYRTGEKPSLRYAHMYLGRKGASNLPTDFKENLYKKTPDWLKYLTSLGAPIVAEAPTFSFFSPFMTEGATKKSTTKTKQVLEKSKTKTKVKKVSANKIIRNLENIWKKSGSEGLTQRLIQISREISKKSGAERLRGIENLELILRDLYRKGLIKDFLYDSNTGQFTILDSVGGSYKLTPIHQYTGFGTLQIEALPSMGKTKLSLTESAFAISRQSQSRFQTFGVIPTLATATLQTTAEAQKERLSSVFGAIEKLGTATATTLSTGLTTPQPQKTERERRQVFGSLGYGGGFKSRTKRRTFGELIFPLPKFKYGVDKRRKIKKPKLRTPRRAYQPSVGAVSLGISISPQQAKRLPKTFSGLMLRPMIKRQPKRPKRKPRKIKPYPTSVNQMFGVLYSKKSRKKSKNKRKKKSKSVRR